MPLIKLIEKYPLLSILALVGIIFLPNLQALPVTIMEARNFITAREMLSEGNWILTTMNGIPRYEKPPLPTWLSAISGLFFGIKSVFALRLPTVAMVCITGIYTFFLSKKLVDRRHSFINALIVITSFYVIGITIEAPWDIYTHGFMLMAIYYLYQAYNSRQISHILFASLFIACSVLSKGPVSLYVLFLPFLLAYAMVYGVKKNFLVKTAIPLIAGLLLGGIWFIYVRMADPEAFLKIATTETANWSSYHVKPFYYYWSFFIQSGLWSIPAFIGLLYPYLIKRVENKKAYKLSLFWTIFAVVLLSLIPEKKARYLMPVLIPLAINTGFYIQFLIREFGVLKRKIEIIPVYINFGLLGIVGILSPIIGYFLLEENFNAKLGMYLLSSFLLVTIGGNIVYQLYKKNILNVFYLSVIWFAVIMGSIAPMLTNFQVKTEKYVSISNLQNEAKEQGISIYLLDEMSPEMLWDYGGIIPLIEKEDDVYRFPESDHFGLLVNDENNLGLSRLGNTYSIEKIKTFHINLTKRQKARHFSHYFVCTKKGTN